MSPVQQASFLVPGNVCGSRKQWQPLEMVHTPSALQTGAGSPAAAEAVGSGLKDSRPGGYGITVAELVKLSETPADEIYAASTVHSAKQLAELLGTSLDSGLSSNEAELDKRARVLGANRLPERQQVSCTAHWFP